MKHSNLKNFIDFKRNWRRRKKIELICEILKYNKKSSKIEKCTKSVNFTNISNNFLQHRGTPNCRVRRYVVTLHGMNKESSTILIP